jgi:nicotinate-nucleotide adenylyltransferase
MDYIFGREYKLGVMGGTFDPIHYGHLIAAENARAELALDQVLFVPTGVPPHKKTMEYTEATIRFQMTALAIASNEFFRVSDLETKRDGPSYTIDTVKALRELYPGVQIYFITGADAILEIATWRNAELLLSMCSFVAVSRPGYAMDDIRGRIGSFFEHPEINIFGMEVPALDISSTEIRKRVREGKTIKYMLPDNVMDFITEQGLYQSK